MYGLIAEFNDWNVYRRLQVIGNWHLDTKFTLTLIIRLDESTIAVEFAMMLEMYWVP